MSSSSQPSTLSPQPLSPWSLQPDESPADYLLFTAWLRLPAPRAFRQAAASLDCSVHRLRRLAARHRWKLRVEDIDQQRAEAISAALDQILHDEASGWPERARRFREQEWLLHEEMMEGALQAARDFTKHPRSARLGEIARICDLGSLLGRRSIGMPLDPASAAPAQTSFSPDQAAALHKIYGKDSNISARL